MINDPLRGWLHDLFEYEDCDECGQGADNHTVIHIMGQPFAKCASGMTKADDDEDRMDADRLDPPEVE